MHKKLACLISAVMLVLVASTLSAQESEHPNIIVILVDDMGIDSVSAFNDKLGFKTPRLDAFAEEGMSFSDAHSGSSVCSPTRYGLLTGRYAWRTRLKQGVVPRWDRPLIARDRLTLGGMLKTHGYNTACIGKWHLGWNWPLTSQEDVPIGDCPKRRRSGRKGFDLTKPVTGGPLDFGFDYYFGDDVINYEPSAYIENDRVLGNPDKNNKWKAADYSYDEVLSTVTSKALSYIETQAKGDDPCFLYFAFNAVHNPIAPSEKFKGISGISPYVDFVIETDDSIGQVIDAVDESEIADNTLLIVTCDNGTSLGHAQRFPLKVRGSSIRGKTEAGSASVS